MATAPAKRAPRKRTASTATAAEATGVPIAADGTFQPVRIGKNGRTPNPMVDLFELDGRMYQIPARPNPAVTMRFMREARDPQQGIYVATLNMLVTLLGQEALDALADSPETTEEDFADVIGIVSRIAFDAGQRIAGSLGN